MDLTYGIKAKKNGFTFLSFSSNPYPLAGTTEAYTLQLPNLTIQLPLVSGGWNSNKPLEFAHVSHELHDVQSEFS